MQQVETIAARWDSLASSGWIATTLVGQVHTYPIEDIALEISPQQGYTAEGWENRGFNLGARVSVCMGSRCGQSTEDGRKLRMFCECSHTVSRRGKAQLVPHNRHGKHKGRGLFVRSTALVSLSWHVPLDPHVVVPHNHRYSFRYSIDKCIEGYR